MKVARLADFEAESRVASMAVCSVVSMDPTWVSSMDSLKVDVTVVYSAADLDQWMAVMKGNSQVAMTVAS